MKSVLVQFVCSFILTFQCALSSFSIVWPSYALKALQSEDSPLGFPLSSYESNLVGSIPMLGSVIGTASAGYISEAIGRKKSQILTTLIFVVAWSLIATARSTVQILTGRFFIGLALGLTVVIVMIFLGEISQLSVRGNTIAFGSLIYNVGILLSYLQGWFCSYTVVCYLNVMASVAYIIVLCFLKETPVYLLKIGKEKEALDALKFYRGESQITDAVLDEFSFLKSQDMNDKRFVKEVENTNIAEKEKLRTENDALAEIVNENPWKLLFTVDYNRRALITTVMFMVLCVFMGMIAVQTYAAKFFAIAAPTMSPDLCSVLLALTLIVSCGVSTAVTNLVPRRVLMTSTCLVTSICLAVLGSLLRSSWGPNWIAPFTIMIFCLLYHLGCINVIYVQVSECFGPQVNSAATAIVFGSMFFANFGVLFLFEPAESYLGIDVTFFALAVIAAITAILSYFFLKETRFVPLEKVQKMFSQGYLHRKCDTTCY